MSLPKITAIMPAYNAEATVAAAVTSVRSQTATEWELVLVDDGSTDRTLEVAQQVAEGDDRIRIINAPHGGRGEARNRCLEHAHGSYVVICDSDDISLLYRFEKQSQYLEDHPEVHVVSSARVICFTPDQTQAFAVLGPSSDAAIRRTFDRGRMPILFASAMLRMEVFRRFGLFDEELHRNQDYGFLARIYRDLRFGTIPESLILYRTTGLVVERGVVAENNFYRYYANRRVRGEQRSASEVRSTLRWSAYRSLLTPLQYAWYVTKRRLLRRGIRALNSAEARLLAATLGTATPREVKTSDRAWP